MPRPTRPPALEPHGDLERGIDEWLLDVGGLQGLPGYLTLPIFARRDLAFNMQERTGIGSDYSLEFSFYHSVGDLTELTAILDLMRSLIGGDVPRGLAPAIELSLDIFPSIYDASAGVVPDPQDGEKCIGGHAVIPVKSESGYIAFQHSWTDWGVKGFGALTLSYAERYWREAWSQRTHPGGPPLALGKDASEMPSVKVRDWWLGERVQFSQVANSEDMDILCRDLTIGIGLASRRQYVAVKKNPGSAPVVVAWAVVRPDVTTVIEEFFVWPPYRGLGIGSYFAREMIIHLAIYLTISGYHSVEWLASKADIIVRDRITTPPRVPSWMTQIPWEPCDRAAYGAAARCDVLELMELLTST